MPQKEQIILGSGKLYVKEVTGGTIPTVEELETDENRFSHIKGGCVLEYVPTFYKAEDDLQEVSKEILQAEDVTLKTGLMTVKPDSFKVMASTIQVGTEQNGVITVKVGGVGNFKNIQYAFLFVHEDTKDGDVRVLVVGKNTKGFTLNFQPDKETICDMEIKGESLDATGVKANILMGTKTSG